MKSEHRWVQPQHQSFESHQYIQCGARVGDHWMSKSLWYRATYIQIWLPEEQNRMTMRRGQSAEASIHSSVPHTCMQGLPDIGHCDWYWGQCQTTVLTRLLLCGGSRQQVLATRAGDSQCYRSTQSGDQGLDSARGQKRLP